MILTPYPVNADKFTFHNGKFTADISDLGLNFKFERVYDDACDRGFSIINHKTGNIGVFRMELIDGNPEDGIEGWHFSCIQPSHLTHLKALVIND